MEISCEVRVADVLEQFEYEPDMTFTCHAVAKLLNRQFQFTDSNFGWRCYVSFEKRFMDQLHDQVTAQLGKFLVALECIPQYTAMTSFDDIYYFNNGQQVGNVRFEVNPRKFRIQVLTMILNMDPEAVFHFELNSNPE